MQYDEHKLVEYFADAPAGVGFSDLDLNNIPHHISCIMDGNGRWATSRGLARTEGHKAGIVSLREIITACVRLGVDVLSAYAFSTENWNRPQHEVNVLMHLFAKTFIDELPLLKRENVRVVFLGDISALPKKTRDVFERGLAECANHTGMTLALAVNYGARAEITRAVRQIALDAAAGKIDPGAIDDDMVASHLYTAGLPDPELVIRTSGELRLSNYLLWQVAYSEFYVTDTYWPDFDRWGLVDAILAYQGRDRRFGGLSKTEQALSCPIFPRQLLPRHLSARLSLRERPQRRMAPVRGLPALSPVPPPVSSMPLSLSCAWFWVLCPRPSLFLS